MADEKLHSQKNCIRRKTAFADFSSPLRDKSLRNEVSMPLPLKPGYHFNYERITRPTHYEMNSAEAYTDFYGISFMLSGERMIYSPNFTTIVQAGELTFIPKNVYRRTTYISNSPYERILIKFTDSMIKELLDNIGEDVFENLCKEHVLRFNKTTQKKIISIFDRMEQEWKAYNAQSELLLKGMLNELIITCIRERLVNGTDMLQMEKKHEYLFKAIQYIKANLRDNPSLQKTAEYINISPSYLSKLFVSYLNTPFSAFILNEKISYARKLIVETDLTMTKIAEETGFSSNAYFSDCFHRATGYSPLKFRKRSLQK